jgi:hypothetical protein
MREEKLTDSFVLENTYHWPADGESRPWTEFWVTTFSRPVGRVKSASILYSIHQGQHWEQRAMEKSCVLGDQDVWHVGLGTFPAGTRIRYAVEGIDENGVSVWDNCYGKDHQATIGSPQDFFAKSL